MSNQCRVKPGQVALICLVPVLVMTLHAAADTVLAQKMKPEEVVAKHLESIGAVETRESINSRIITGTVVVTFREPGTGQLGGRAVIASESSKSMMGLIFENSNYPHEKIGYDGEDVTASYVRPGIRSALGNFFMTYKNMVKQGILGGALTDAWALANLKTNKARVEYGGRKKVGDRQTHEIKYFPRGGLDLRVSLFFDSETFQHIRTEYTRTVPAVMGGTPEASASQRETRYKLVEDFSDFKRAGGLILPHTYKLTLEIRAATSSFSADWELALSEFLYNQNLEPGSFKVDNN